MKTETFWWETPGTIPSRATDSVDGQWRFLEGDGSSKITSVKKKHAGLSIGTVVEETTRDYSGVSQKLEWGVVQGTKQKGSY
jgi:hypothetical protein